MGDREELDRWARRVVPRALAYARSLTRDPSRADDLVQECLYRLLRRADRYDLVADGVKLLFRAITNLAINEASRTRTLASLDGGGDDDRRFDVEDRLAVMPEEELARRELQEALDAAMGGLPPMQRAALELRALGQGKADIAAVLRVSESNAGVLVFRARQALAAALAPLLGDRRVTG
ncbi:MAG: RNA polymerase sigma factor [Gemmataceae bacterium]